MQLAELALAYCQYSVSQQSNQTDYCLRETVVTFLHKSILQYNTNLSVGSVRRDKYRGAILIPPRVEGTEMRLALHSPLSACPSLSRNE
jgi:hypothetical protein